ncbi:MAG: ABC transporter permease [Erysipelotrichaceae bacterium]
MIRYIRLYSKFLKQYLKSLMEYRLDFMFGMFGFILIQGLGVVFLQLVFQQIPSLEGWNFYEVLFLYGLAQIPRGIDHVFTDYLWIFAQQTIVKGDFDRMLLRPLNPLFQVIAMRFQPEGFGEIIVGGLLIFTAIQRLDLIINIQFILTFTIIILFATLIYTAIKLAAASLAFWFKFSQSYLYMVYQISNFVKYPLDIFPSAMRFVLTFLIPFAFTGYFPGAYLLGKGNVMYGVVLVVVMGVISILLAYAFWKHGITRYESAGN